MEEILVTVIVPYFNAYKTIYSCLESIKKQTFNNLQVIIVDDCSTDTSIEVVFNFIKEDKRFSILRHSENKGVSAARNLGIKHAKGKFIYFIDADDWIKENAIQDLINSYNKTNSQFIGSGHIQYLNKDKENIKDCEIKNSLILNSNDIYKYIINYLKIPYKFTLFVHCWNKLYLSSIIKQNNIFFDENLSQLEDVNFNFNYILNIESASFDINNNYYHRIEDKNSSASGKAGTENNAVHNCIIAFKPIKKALNKHGVNNLSHNNEIGHHFITTSIIYLIRLTRNYIKQPSKQSFNYIRDWVNSENFKKNVQFYKLQNGESHLLHICILTKNVYIIFLGCLLRISFLR